MTSLRRAGVAAALATAPFALAYRFAIVYRGRAGYPRPRPPGIDPSALGLPFEAVDVPSGDLRLPGWFVPARDGASGPGVVLVHGWESARDRMLPNALFLHAAGFHCLLLDVRGQGANAVETLPVSAGEFGADALAGVAALRARPEVTSVGMLGHSMGGVGAILAAAAEPAVRALVATSAPADPYRLTRQTFRLARLPLPDPVAYPLAWLTTRVYLNPRGHRVTEVSASAALARYEGAILIVHGARDEVVPVGHAKRLLAIAGEARDRREDGAGPDGGPGRPLLEHLFLPDGRHSWLYEFEEYRRAVAGFLAESLGGPLSRAEAAAAAAAVPAMRIPDPEAPFSAVAEEPGGYRSLARVVRVARPARLRPAPDEPSLPGAPDDVTADLEAAG